MWLKFYFLPTVILFSVYLNGVCARADEALPVDTVKKKIEAEKAHEGALNENVKQLVNEGRISPQEVKIDFLWKKTDFPFDVRLYELPQVMINQLRSDRNVMDIEKSLPIVRELKDHTVVLKGETFKIMALAIKNPTNKPVWFFAAPHKVEPAKESIGVKFICLCIGDAFRIKPQHTWYRIVMVKLFPAHRSPWYKFTHKLIRAKEGEIPSADRPL